MTGGNERPGRLAGYASRYLITSWIIIWIIAACLAPILFQEAPQMLRLVCALGFMLGSVAGETLFLPLVRERDMQAFASVIASGIFAIFLMGVGFLTLFAFAEGTIPGSQAFYVFMLPGSVIWFSGGMYLAISRWYPDMRDVRLSLRPWRPPKPVEEDRLQKIKEKQDQDLQQQERIIEKLDEMETKIEGDERRKAD